MSAQYDGIAEQYLQTKTSPLRRYVEVFTFMDLIGDVAGQSVLDLACGDGFYTRQLKERGADRVVGVDISPRMVELAGDQERAAPLGIEYVCSDVQDMPNLGRFDLVAAAYLLHYAPSETALTRMCVRISDHLKPDGRFVTLNENPEQPAEQYAGYTQYGFNKAAKLPLRDGSPITYWMISGHKVINFTAHFFSTETYQRVFTAAGLRSVQWHPLRLSDEGQREHGHEYWEEYMNNPPVVAIECRP